MNLKTAVDRGAIAQLIGSPALAQKLAQKPQLTHRVSPRFCTNAFNPSSCTLHPRSTAVFRLNRRQHRGSVLIFTLWILVCLSLIALGFGRRARLEVRAAAYEMDHLTARLLAHAAIEAGMAELRKNFNQNPGFQALSDAWAKEQEVPADEILGPDAADFASAVTVTYLIVDENRKININRADREFLRNFDLLPGSIASDIIARRFGEDEVASGDDYLFAVPEELLQLDNLDVSDWIGDPDSSELSLRDAVTVYGSGKLNINTAPEEVIAAIPGLRKRVASAIVDRRPFKNFSELKKLRGVDSGDVSLVEKYCRLTSSHFTITGKAQMHNGRVVAVVSAVVRRNQSTRTQPIAWREG